MLQIRTIINNEIKYLDLFNNEDITMNISYAEIQDITKKNSGFSQNFRIPGSKNNNDIFNHFYDTNAVTIDFDPKEKFTAQILNNGMELFNGYIRLNSTTLTNNEIIYNITFYSEVGDLISGVADKFIYELDFSEYDFTGYTANTIGYLFDPDLNPFWESDPRPYVNGSVYFGIINKGYEYSADTSSNFSELKPSVIPRLNWTGIDVLPLSADTWDNPSWFVPHYYTTPSLRIKDIYTKIFDEAGYQIQSDFFDTAYFKRYYLPLTTSSDDIYLNQAIEPQYSFEREDASGIPLSSYTWTEISDGSTEIDQRRFSNIVTIVDNFNASVGSPQYFTLLPGEYTATISYDAEVLPVGGGDPEDTLIFTPKLRNQDPVSLGETPFWTSGNTSWVGQGYPIVVNESITDNEYSFTFNTTGDELRHYAMDMDISPAFGNVGSLLGKITRFRFTITSGPKILADDTFSVNDELVGTEIKQIDFLTSINKAFNLLVMPIPSEPKTLRVEPIIDWIGKGDTLDWSPKIDRDRPITVQPVNTIVNGTLDYPQQEDAGWTNNTFKEKKDKEFGSKLLELNTDYKDRVTKFDTIFSSQVDFTLVQNNEAKGLTMPGYFVTETKDIDGNVYQQFKPYKTPPKLLFRSIPIPINSSVTVGNSYFNLNPDPTYYWYNNHRCITYPFGASGLTHYSNFDKTDIFDTQEIDLSDYEDFYDVYYKDYIDDLMNTDNRIIEASIYLTPEEVASLEFNEKILIDNSYYRINQIRNLSLLNPNIASVELVKLTKDYRPHRVRYYDLINCTGGTDLHTHTDLNFGIYAYKGYDIKIDGECYNVQAGEYNPSYRYERLNISDVYQSGCTCLTSLINGGGFNGDYYDELEPTPTPTPSPTSITPTPTPSLTQNYCDCREYEIVNTGETQMNFTYEDCNTRDIIGDFLLVGEDIRVCLCEGSFTITQGQGYGLNLGECTLVTPTPSVTPTYSPTPTYTPTNTVTPSTSASEAPFTYRVVNCDDPGDIRIVGSTNGTLTPPKAVRLSCCPTLCFEVDSQVVGTQVDTIVQEFTACETCPR